MTDLRALQAVIAWARAQQRQSGGLISNYISVAGLPPPMTLDEAFKMLADMAEAGFKVALRGGLHPGDLT